MPPPPDAPLPDDELGSDELDPERDDARPLTQKQRAILNAALEVFSQQGFARTATAEIAKRAGVAEGTIFRTWRTKKDLLIALVTPVILKLVAPRFVKEIEDIADAEGDDLRAFVLALYRNRLETAVKQHPRAVRILLQEVAFHPEIQEQLRGQAEQRLVPPLIAAILRFQRAGVVQSGPPEAVLRLLVVNIAGLLVSGWFSSPERPLDEEAELQRTVDFVVAGLRGVPP